MPTNTDLVTDLPADFAVFGQGVDTTMADLKGGTTGQILSKATNTDMDFTWITNDVGDITAVNVTSPITGGGSSGAVTVGIQSASTSQSGAVQLSDSTSTTSSVLASTPTATKAAYDLANTANTTANAAVAKSTVTAKGSIFTATASATPAQITAGNNGEALYADSSATTGLRYSATPSASNPVLNSALQIWQRGTSISLTASSGVVYTADRWSTSTNANQACTVARQATGDTTNLPNIQYAMRYQRNSGQTGTGLLLTTQSLETINSIPFAGKTITISFYARAGANFSSASSILINYFMTGTGTDQNRQSGAYTGEVTASNNATLTTTWQRFSYTYSVAATATEIATGFAYTPVGTAGTNDYFEITGVQIDIGSVALPFRTAGVTYQAELAACQRYYYRWTTANGGSNVAYSNAVFSYASTQAFGTMQFPVTMRTTPTSVETTGTASNYRVLIGGTATTCSGVPVYDQGNPYTIMMQFPVASGLTVGQAGVAGANISSTAFLGFSAEL